MNDRDQRPRFSAMPAHLEPVYDRRAPEAHQLVETVFREVLASGASMSRNPAELQNDALSLASQIVAHGGVALAARFSAEKGVSLRRAVEMTVADLVLRIHCALDMLEAADAAKEATKQ